MSANEWFRGEEIRDTGKRVKLHGATWRVCVYLTGSKVGQDCYRPDDATSRRREERNLLDPRKRGAHPLDKPASSPDEGHKGEAMREYFIDRIDDSAREQLSVTVRATDDDDAKQQARTIIAERGWEAAEVWDKSANMFIAEVCS